MNQSYGIIRRKTRSKTARLHTMLFFGRAPHVTEPVDRAIILQKTIRRSVQALAPNAISGRKL